MATLAEQHV